MNKFGEYAPMVVQGLMTILVVNHWYRGLDVLPLIVLWVILLGLSISPMLDIIYGNTNEEDELALWEYEQKEQDYLEREYNNSVDQSDNLPHKEEMEEEYQPYE